MSILRSFAAVVIGYLIFAVSAALLFRLSGRDPHAPQDLPFMILTMVYGIVFAALGGMAAVRIAGRRPALHAALLSGLIALGATVSLISSPGAHATWSQWGALLLMAPSASLMPWLARRRSVA